MRYELNKLSTMKHAFVVRFVGVLTNPLCFVLEWAPGKSLEHTRMAHVEANSSICPTALFLVLLQVSPECCIHNMSICITCTVMGTMRLSDKVSALAITVESETIHTTFVWTKSYTITTMCMCTWYMYGVLVVIYRIAGNFCGTKYLRKCSK